MLNFCKKKKLICTQVNSIEIHLAVWFSAEGLELTLYNPSCTKK